MVSTIFFMLLSTVQRGLSIIPVNDRVVKVLEKGSISQDNIRTYYMETSIGFVYKEVGKGSREDRKLWNLWINTIRPDRTYKMDVKGLLNSKELLNIDNLIHV